MKIGTVLLIFTVEHIGIILAISIAYVRSHEEIDQHGFDYVKYKSRFGKAALEHILSRFPCHIPSLDHLTHYFYTRKHRHHGYPYKIQECQTNIKIKQKFDRSKPVFFIIHGFRDSYKGEYSQTMKDAILHKRNVNVFLVDWSPIVDLPYLAYKFARNSVIDTGKLIACFINSLLQSYKLSPKQFRIIGHSLGAHVSGVAGSSVRGKVGYLVGLDPAGPLFSAEHEDCISRYDADLVHIIHTNGLRWCLWPELIICDGFGLRTPVGHVDYYPNGGRHQPGCSKFDFSCHHARSWQFYNESILNGTFEAQMCKNYERFKSGKCKHNPTTILPSIPFRTNTLEGNYFLLTKSKSPYSMGHDGIRHFAELEEL